jgi:hypothetical protein
MESVTVAAVVAAGVTVGRWDTPVGILAVAVVVSRDDRSGEP